MTFIIQDGYRAVSGAAHTEQVVEIVILCVRQLIGQLTSVPRLFRRSSTARHVWRTRAPVNLRWGRIPYPRYQRGFDQHTKKRDYTA